MVEALLLLLLGCGGANPAPEPPSAEELIRQHRDEVMSLCVQPAELRVQREELEAMILVERDPRTRVFITTCLVTLGDPRSEDALASALFAERDPYTEWFLFQGVLGHAGAHSVDTIVEKYLRGIDPSNEADLLRDLAHPDRADRTRAALTRLSAIDPARARRILDALDGKRASPTE